MALAALGTAAQEMPPEERRGPQALTAGVGLLSLSLQLPSVESGCPMGPWLVSSETCWGSGPQLFKFIEQSDFPVNHIRHVTMSLKNQALDENLTRGCWKALWIENTLRNMSMGKMSVSIEILKM